MSSSVGGRAAFGRITLSIASWGRRENLKKLEISRGGLEVNVAHVVGMPLSCFMCMWAPGAKGAEVKTCAEVMGLGG